MSSTLIIITALTIFIGFVFPSKKSVTGLMLLYMWMLFAFNTLNSDYTNYKYIFTAIGNGNKWTMSHYEPGFVAMCSFCANVLHMDYSGFNMLMATICTILFALVLKLYCEWKYQNLVISFFIIVEYWVMICQYRYYLAMLLVLIGIHFYMNRSKIRGSVIFICFLALGILFHYSTIIFIVILLSDRINYKKMLYIIPVSIAVIFAIRNGYLNSVISIFIPAYKIQRWIYSEARRSMIGILLLISTRLLLLFTEKLALQGIKKSNLSESSNQQSSLSAGVLIKMDGLFKVTMSCFVLIILEMFDKNYERLFRLPMFLLFVFISYYCRCKKITVKRIPLGYFLSVSYVGLYMITFYISFAGWFHHNLYMVLTYNSIFGVVR